METILFANSAWYVYQNGLSMFVSATLLLALWELRTAQLPFCQRSSPAMNPSGFFASYDDEASLKTNITLCQSPRCQSPGPGFVNSGQENLNLVEIWISPQFKETFNVATQNCPLGRDWSWFGGAPQLASLQAGITSWTIIPYPEPLLPVFCLGFF